MKRIKKLLRLLLALLLLAAIVFAWWQRDNLKALIAGTQYTPEELEQQMEENRQSIQSAVETVPDVTVRSLTDEERHALREGTISETELIERLTEKAPQETPQPDANLEYEQQLSKLIAELYVLREQYQSILDGMVDEARGEYAAMPESERTKSKLVKWAGGYIGRATDLEKQCDAQIDEIAKELAELIRANNGDLKLVDQLVYNYANEKRLKKSWYLSQLEKRGLLG